MSVNNWQPTANINTLKARAALVAAIREFFHKKGVLEVDTPLLCQHGVTDVFVNNIEVGDRQLQTSPEYAMKRLLAAGSGSIYQITKAFRDDPCSKRHQPEFTLLEWYRVGFTLEDLMQETDELLQQVLRCPPAQLISYQALFNDTLGFNPHEINQADLLLFVQQHLDVPSAKELSKTTLLELCFSHCIEPTLGKEQPIFLHSFPLEQAALAKIKNGVAQRFEVYYQGLELANAFEELLDAEEQLARFQQDNVKRRQLGLPEKSIDPYLMAALQAGLPDCAGIALGLDRLLMLQLGLTDIRETIGFSWENS